MTRKSKLTTHEDYLATMPPNERAALEKLRRIIRSAAPRADECISYRLPAFRFDGKVLVLFGATATHCSFFPGSGTAVEAHRDDLEGYSTSKGTIRFDAAKPLPAALVRKIVKYRIAEIAARRSLAAVRALLDGGANPRLRNESESTPLHLAVQTTGRSGSGSEEARRDQAGIIKLLLERGAKPTDEDARGKPVARAASSEWIRALLSDGKAG